jgi:putative transcription factor
MGNAMTYYCELCGKTSLEPLKPIDYYGEKLLVCKDCFSKSRRKSDSGMPIIKSGMNSTGRPQAKPRQTPEYDIVENYSQVIRQTREKMGLTIQQLSAKIGLKESILRRIEAGKFSPDISTTRKIERFLKIVLLVKREQAELVTPNIAAEHGLELRHVAKLKENTK